MVDRRHEFRPTYGVPPGASLAEALLERHWSQAELARRTGRPLKAINDIVRGRAVITGETAIQLERVLDIDASFWLRLEADYRAVVARERERKKLSMHGDWLGRFPIKELRALNKLPATNDKSELVDALLRFFGVATIEAWEDEWAKPNAAYLQSTAYDASQHAVSAWLRLGELRAEAVLCGKFDADGLRALVRRTPALTRQKDTAEAMATLKGACADVGVALILQPGLAKTRIFGATRWISADKVMIELSGRYRREDYLWFAFLHECAHVLLHGKRGYFVDLDDIGSSSLPIELEANSFAEGSFIPNNEFEAFVSQGAFDELNVRRFAQRIGVSPGIVVGRLQHYGQLGWQQLNNLRRPVNLVP